MPIPAREIEKLCGLTANGEGHHGGDPDCICDKLHAACDFERKKIMEIVERYVDFETGDPEGVLPEFVEAMLWHYSQLTDEIERRDTRKS